MRRLWLVAVSAMLSVTAQAQIPPSRDLQPNRDLVPRPSLQNQGQDDSQAPIQDQAPADVQTPSDDPQMQAVVPPPAPDMTPEQRPNVWLPAGAAKLQALDKVNAQATAMSVKVGQSATFGSLTVTVRSCVVRPPDQPADAAAYLDVTDSHPDSPPFNGWLLWHEPAVSMMEHPIYDIRVAGCT